LLYKYCNKISIRSNKIITHRKLLNIVSYNIFITNVYNSYKDTLLKIKVNNESETFSRSLTNKNKIIYESFHIEIQNSFINLISYNKDKSLYLSNSIMIRKNNDLLDK
jgi:hypothetical protein